MPVSSAPPGPSKGWTIVGRVKAGMVVLTAALAMIACVGIHPLLQGIARSQNLKIEGYARIYLDMPWIGVLLGIPRLRPASR